MWALLLPVAYLLGTFPSAAIVARTSGIDIRTVGSGNPGASNVARVLGWRKGIWVFVLDAAKGAIAAGLGLIVADRVGGYALGAAARAWPPVAVSSPCCPRSCSSRSPSCGVRRGA